jgi:RNAse (barnase) inhibitor barstar
MEKNLIYLQTQKAKASNKKVLDDICTSIYDEILAIINRESFFGNLKIIFGLSYENCSYYIVPLMIYHFHNLPELKERFFTKLKQNGFNYKEYDNKSIEISWDNINNDIILPTISAHNLTQMGYPTNLLGTILHELKVALVKGEATIMTQQSQILWIKEHFVLK